MNKITKIFSAVFMFAAFVSVTPAFADVISSTSYVSTDCTNLTTLLSYGKYDASTKGEVSALQTFLHAKGYLSVTATGYFGPMTRTAVKSFQKENGLSADGIVGTQTRAHIFAKDCSGTAVPPTPYAPVITAISPAQSVSGATVTLTGTGFTNSNIVHFAIGGIGPIAATNNGTSISFVVPSTIGPYCKPDQACPMYLALINAGTYNVSVENDNGTSNIVQFTVVQ